MDIVTVNQFREHLRDYVERVLTDHEPLQVSRRNGGAFVVIGANDWAQEQETLYILQNQALMTQIVRSAATYASVTGRLLTAEEQSEIDRI